MDDWPELEDAYNERELENLKFVRELDAELFVSKTEEELKQRAEILERMEPWKYLEQRLSEIAAEMGTPVMRLLKQMSMAYFYLKPDESDKFLYYFKLTTSGRQYPPELCWETEKGKWYMVSRFMVKLIIDKQGEPLRFEITCREEQVLTCTPTLEALKETLVDAFRLGPHKSHQFKSHPGIPLKYDE